MENNQINHNIKRILSIAHDANRELKREGNNKYLKSLLNPGYQSKYPDCPPSYSYTKNIKMSDSFKVPEWTGFSDEFRLVMPTRSPINGVCFERRDTNGDWYHNRVIPFAQIIKDPRMYLRYRLVSGQFGLHSASVPIGNTVLNGELNGVKIAYVPPEFGDSDFSQLLPYATTTHASRNNVGVYEGIMAFIPHRN